MVRNATTSSSVRWAARLLASVSVALLAACTLPALLNPPQRLLEDARAAIDARDFDTAYRQLAEIRRRYPDSEQSVEAFPLAAALFHRGYFQSRHTEPTSHWVKVEPEFMLDWFASFFEHPEFPQTQAEALFVGMHYGYFREYLAYAATRPELSRWVVRVEDDNGMIESIVADPRDPGAS
jgi:hypothetical protein